MRCRKTAAWAAGLVLAATVFSCTGETPGPFLPGAGSEDGAADLDFGGPARDSGTPPADTGPAGDTSAYADGGAADAAAADAGASDGGGDAGPVEGGDSTDSGGHADIETGEDATVEDAGAVDSGTDTSTEGDAQSGDTGADAGGDGGAGDSGADAGCPVRTCTEFGTCATYQTCEPCPETPLEICNGADDDCNPATPEEGLQIDCPPGELCRGGTCCADECGPVGAKKCADSAHARLCGQGDADLCIEWKAPEECPVNYSCVGAGDCVCGGVACNGACCAAGQVCGRFSCCVQETDAQFCARLGRICGPVSGNDLCGWGRTAECGVCTQFPGSFCKSGGCQCQLKNCTPGEIECGGPWSNDCGGTFLCPDCTPPASCVGGRCEPPDAGYVDAGEDAGEDAGDDSGADGGADGGIDGGAAGDDAGPDAGPDSGEEPANIVLPALTASVPVRLDADKGNQPSLFFETGKVFAFYNDTKADEPAKTMLYQRRSPTGGAAFDPAREVSEGSFGADVVNVAGELVIAAATGQVTLFFGSTDDGDGWHFHQSIWATDGPCETTFPSRFLRPVPPDPAIAQSFLHRGLFGCQDETRYVASSGGTWGTGQEIGSGTPSGAFRTGGRITVGTAWGAVYSDDGGSAWTAWPQGGTTRDQVRGTGMGMDDQDRLYLTNQYNYANEYALVLIISDPGASGWGRRVRLHASAYAITDSLAAVRGSKIVVVWRGSKDGTVLGSYFKMSVFAMFSPDYGASWTAPVQIDAAPADRNIGGIAVASDGAEAAIAWGETGEGISYDFRGVYFTRVTW
ncbi:MAG: hypothetical protein HY897_13280 [Deltaproteobacteria bacterium]|nr:hypothetical protein [Deltaproteobacteria bacterium]